MLRARLILPLLLGLAACGDRPAAESPAPPPPRPPVETDSNRLQAAQTALIEAEKPFHMTYAIWMGGRGPVGIHCDAPPLQGQGGAALYGPGSYYISDVPGQDDRDELERRQRDGQARNLRIVEDPAYPYPDVCRPRRDDDPHPGPHPASPLAGARPVRAVTGPARSLHDAARRGTAQEVRDWAGRGLDIDTPDIFGLTPLGWAVLRGREEAIGVLLEFGADPDNRLPHGRSARWLAARSGNEALFTLLGSPAAPGLRPDPDLLEAAAESGSHRIVSRVLAASEEGDVAWPLVMQKSLGEDQRRIRSILLSRGGQSAADALLTAAIWGGALPAFDDALDAGADVNRTVGCSAPLTLAAAGKSDDSDVMVERLLAAGARVDVRSRRDNEAFARCQTPLAVLLAETWRHSNASSDPAQTRRGRILRLLLAKRPDMDATGSEGQPLVVLAVAGRFTTAEDWSAGKNRTLAEPLPDSWMRALLAAGMDINARWQGRTALDWAIRAYGPESEAVRRLRTYGARAS